MTFYFKNFSFPGVILVTVFGPMNLYWMIETFEERGIDYSTWWGLDMVQTLGLLLLWFLVSLIIGWKKTEVKKSD